MRSVLPTKRGSRVAFKAPTEKRGAPTVSAGAPCTVSLSWIKINLWSIPSRMAEKKCGFAKFIVDASLNGKQEVYDEIYCSIACSCRKGCPVKFRCCVLNWRSLYSLNHCSRLYFISDRNDLFGIFPDAPPVLHCPTSITAWRIDTWSLDRLNCFKHGSNDGWSSIEKDSEGYCWYSTVFEPILCFNLNEICLAFPVL